MKHDGVVIILLGVEEIVQVPASNVGWNTLCGVVIWTVMPATAVLGVRTMLGIVRTKNSVEANGFVGGYGWVTVSVTIIV